MSSFSEFPHHPNLHSFPTRRSSDLFALATGDLLGQLAAEDYVEKLPILYGEFAEAAKFSNDERHFVASFSSAADLIDRKSTRLNSSHTVISYAVFCLKKKR